MPSYWIYFFKEAPKKQKHNPCSLLLDLLFWNPKKSKNTTLVPSYWICFFLDVPKKQKHNPCVLLLDLLFGLSYWICFFGSPKKAKTQPLCPPIGFAFLAAAKKAKTKPLCPLIAFAFFGSPKKAKKTGALVLDVLFRKPQKRKSTTLMQSTNTTLVLSCWICFFGSLEKRKQPPRPGPPDATCPWHES